VLGIFLWLKRRTMRWSGPEKPEMSPASQSAIAGLILGFGILWTVITAAVVLSSHSGAKQAMSNGSAHLVEGVVEDFHPRTRKRDKERFRVGDVRFEYSDNVFSVGFHQSNWGGGPIRAGLPVRIHYVGSPSDATILKLEIR